ncbi:MAG: glycosyltransferase family 39 protein [Candidatus Levybacteria bacterium]|nr:glycosyltransferase family 39 protein [Candidatus Levybacteria bacterium]
MGSLSALFKNKASKFNFAVIFILLLGLFLRIHNYTQSPPRGSSSDEYSYSFMGVSLLTKGVPTTWSNLQAYEKFGSKRQNLTIDNIYFPLVTPYFDHPPLNGILVGGWALLNGENTFEKVTTRTIRQVPIFLGMISSLLLFLLTLNLYGKKTAVWALLIYSCSTIIVMNTRFVFAENLVTPLLLLSLLILVVVKKNLSIKQILLLSLLSGLAFWAKEFGLVVFFTTLSILIYEKTKWKYIALFTIFSIFLMSLYLLYGYLYNWELYKAVIFTQSSRIVGPNTLYTLFFHPIIVNKLYFDGWYLLGFVSFFAAFKNFSKNKFILLPSFIYFFIMLFFLNHEGEMGWYMITMFPFFSILTASLLVESIKKKGWYIFVTSIFVGMYIAQYLLDLKYGLTNLGFRFFLVSLLLPLFASYVLKREKIYSFLSNVWFYGLILATIYITYYYIHPL